MKNIAAAMNIVTRDIVTRAAAIEIDAEIGMNLGGHGPIGIRNRYINHLYGNKSQQQQ